VCVGYNAKKKKEEKAGQASVGRCKKLRKAGVKTRILCKFVFVRPSRKPTRLQPSLERDDSDSPKHRETGDSNTDVEEEHDIFPN
jgi:hypothetical protein